MAGLILLAALAGLITLLFRLSGWLVRKLPIVEDWKPRVRWLIVVGAFPLMMIDEIIGMYQFKKLCATNGFETVDVSKIKNKMVRVTASDRKFLSGKVVPIKVSLNALFDAQSSELLVEYSDYFASGGWLMRYTPLGMGGSTPMLFHGNGCGFHLMTQIRLKNKIIYVN